MITSKGILTYRKFIAPNLIKAFKEQKVELKEDLYSALLFLDNKVGMTNLSLEVIEGNQIKWVCDSGRLLGQGDTRIEAVEDVLRQYLFEIRNENKR